MAASSSFPRESAERRGRWGSPERTVVWTEPKPKAKPASSSGSRKVAVLYYLCHRHGHLDHPHFLEMDLAAVPSSAGAGGLYLRDFMDRLNALRGSGMASMYSWSSKRSYKNGYVWQDLTEDDLIHPAHANEYVLKGSQLLLLPQPPPARHESFSSSSSSAAACRRAAGHRKNWSSFDLGEYNAGVALRGTAQLSAATQTDDRGRPDQESTELAIDEISPPPSSSSPDTLETLINNDVRVAAEVQGDRCREVGVIAGGRMRASAVLMQLFSCGALPVKRDHARGRPDLTTSSGSFSSSHSGSSTTRQAAAEKEADDASGAERLSGEAGSGVLDRDYFSGSLVESSGRRTSGGGDDALLKRSSSCNADRGGVKLQLTAKEVHGRCLPRKPRAQ